ncbi:hypothetical protein [Desulforhabdus sp. TSK]|uniref:hypothetical protein n=1 Tax=Desulforhabdus sp. TSK TaxID=2925014 RepID=UPI001FC82CFF|nr:hypothetical protein [Desulforhabdus sp. TSK]GKT10705.1 hypothetical protein DSTSK_40100 [Desulforhabdus sp. TSK]
MSNEKRVAEPEGGSLRRAIRALTGLVLALFLLGLALTAALHLPFIQKMGVSRFAGQLERRTGYSLQLGSCRMWPFSPLRLADLQVLASGREVLRCPRALIEYRLSRRWPYIVPLEIELYRPILYLEKDLLQGWRIPVPEKRPATPSAGTGKTAPRDASPCTEFPLPRLRVEAGTILGQQDGRQVMALRDVTGAVNMKVDCSSGSPRIKMDLQQWQGGLGFGG